jgi:general secretion pathway protein G
MKCPHCGVSLPSDARFCAGCGQQIPGAREYVPGSSTTWVIVLVACAGGLMLLAIVAIIAAIAIPNFLNAVDRGKQKRTMADVRSIGAALESYSVDQRAYPVAASVDDLREPLVPKYIKSLPEKDGWGRPLQVASTAEGYQLVSFGKDGVPQGCDGGSTSAFSADICFADGEFTQWPEGIQN